MVNLSFRVILNYFVLPFSILEKKKIEMRLNSADFYYHLLSRIHKDTKYNIKLNFYYSSFDFNKKEKIKLSSIVWSNKKTLESS